MSAIFSPCGKYRYKLTRPSETLYPMTGPALFVMLNPSTADASQDDQTIRRCRAFARSWDAAGIVVANLYAFRATNPKALLSCPDPVGPENDEWLHQLAKEHSEVICAWGSNADPVRSEEVAAIFRRAGATLWCLGMTKDSLPRHPLFVPRTQKPVLWEPQVIDQPTENPPATAQEREQ